MKKKCIVGIIFVMVMVFIAAAGLAAQSVLPKTLIFQRVAEPRENAFTLLIPKGWTVEGGIFRVDPTMQGGSGNSIAAKLDFSVKSDAAGSVMVRWLPDMLYFDARNSPAGQMGLFPTGSNYNGMTVYPLMSPFQFIQQIVVPYSHPSAGGFQILQNHPCPKVAAGYQERIRAVAPYLSFAYDAGFVVSSYSENGVRYKEKMNCVIENWGQMGQGMWGNKETFYFRAPEANFSDWEPVFSEIMQSVKMDGRWLSGELKGQIQRGEIAAQTQRDIQRIDNEIAQHRRQTNAEIHHDMFLTLTSQEEFVNPYTNEVETGSNQWKYRWVDQGGEIIYTDEESYDPNIDVRLNRTGFKRTPVRKRKP